jgi:cell division FtsZ-interacting protein ZapD
MVAVTKRIGFLEHKAAFVWKHLCSLLLHTNPFSSHTICQFKMSLQTQPIAAAIIMILELIQNSVNIKSWTGKERSFQKSAQHVKAFSNCLMKNINLFISVFNLI